ncbi:hypothetical protein GCHA_4487 [Paraglaciecola chathamensis S18K6]|uniref:Uncharacterized protein n=1 Tax=Paraglaciecola chathamensis S18K6 TaxID=1127672 RepID=A0AAV3V7Y1_9ALTE|nr:hypothetical protein GCHA_4487 [Paraglaciecola chathamensis S18K6]
MFESDTLPLRYKPKKGRVGAEFNRHAIFILSNTFETSAFNKSLVSS